MPRRANPPLRSGVPPPLPPPSPLRQSTAHRSAPAPPPTGPAPPPAHLPTNLRTRCIGPGLVRFVVGESDTRPCASPLRATLKPRLSRPCAVTNHTPLALSSRASGTSTPLPPSTPPG